MYVRAYVRTYVRTYLPTYVRYVVRTYVRMYVRTYVDGELAQVLLQRRRRSEGDAEAAKLEATVAYVRTYVHT